MTTQQEQHNEQAPQDITITSLVSCMDGIQAHIGGDGLGSVYVVGCS